MESPYLGGTPLNDPSATCRNRPAGAFAAVIGYVQHVDAGALSEIAEAAGGEIHIVALARRLRRPDRAAGLPRPASTRTATRRSGPAFRPATTRSFDQDPRFGACVLTEIASRALSPAINDPGTAIDVIGRAVRVLAVWIEPRRAGDGRRAGDRRSRGCTCPALRLATCSTISSPRSPATAPGSSRCGLRLQKALRSLARLGDGRYRASALRHSRQALQRAEIALTLEEEKLRVREIAADVAAIAVAARG